MVCLTLSAFSNEEAFSLIRSLRQAFFHIFFCRAQTAFAAAHKGDEGHHPAAGRRIPFFQQIKGLGVRHFAAPDKAEGVLEGGDHVATRFGAPQAHEIGAMHQCPASGGQHPRRKVLRHAGHAAHKGVRTDAAELMHCGQAADDGVVVHAHVAAERRPVRHDDVAAELTVMGDVGIGHAQVAAAEARYAAASLRAPVEGGEFPDAVAVSEFKPRHFTLEFQILRLAAHHSVGMDVVAASHFRIVLDDRMGVDAAAVPDDHMFFDDRVGPDFHVFPEARARVDKSRGVMPCEGASVQQVMPSLRDP